MNLNELKLFYVLKVGYNSKGEGNYEFLFTKDETNVDVENWCWDVEPACDNAQPPEEEYVEMIYTLKTNMFDLVCLHEAVDRPYLHGYNTIHALAYESEFTGNDANGFNQYENLYENDLDENEPLIVLHYGITAKKLIEIFYERKFVLNENKEFINSKTIKIQ